MMDTKLVKKLTETQAKIAVIEQQIMEATAQFQQKLTTLKEQDAQLRAAIKDAMEANGVKKFEGDKLTITYIAPTTRKGIDAARLKEEKPRIYKQYLKETPVKSSIRIKVENE